VARLALLAAVGLLVAVPQGRAAHRRPPAAFEPARLLPLPANAVRECKELQRRLPFTFLCPAQLPRARWHWRHGGTPPGLTVERFGNRARPRKPGLLGLGFTYGGHVEPRSGRWFWSRRAWLNRPAYFLHFTIYRRGPEPLPTGLARRCFGVRCGLVKYADGYGLRPGRGYYWANHTWFFWREHGTAWAASLHYFGRPDTTVLLARVLAGLVPARSL
jgi:hypothetical protein